MGFHIELLISKTFQSEDDADAAQAALEKAGWDVSVESAEDADDEEDEMAFEDEEVAESALDEEC